MQHKNSNQSNSLQVLIGIEELNYPQCLFIFNKGDGVMISWPSQKYDGIKINQRTPWKKKQQNNTVWIIEKWQQTRLRKEQSQEQGKYTVSNINKQNVLQQLLQLNFHAETEVC